MRYPPATPPVSSPSSPSHLHTHNYTTINGNTHSVLSELPPPPIPPPQTTTTIATTPTQKTSSHNTTTTTSQPKSPLRQSLEEYKQLQSRQLLLHRALQVSYTNTNTNTNTNNNTNTNTNNNNNTNTNTITITILHH